MPSLALWMVLQASSIWHVSDECICMGCFRRLRNMLCIICASYACDAFGSVLSATAAECAFYVMIGCHTVLLLIPAWSTALCIM
jgi:hypothetical protein